MASSRKEVVKTFPRGSFAVVQSDAMMALRRPAAFSAHGPFSNRPDRFRKDKTVAVLAFEILLNATSMFNHSNVRMPNWLDRVVRWIVVTPDMHRVHHSIAVRETNSNFGFNLPWWDRLFGTYRDQPAAGHEAMTIGIEQFRDPAEQRLDHMLTQPFRDDDRSYAPGRRESAQ